MKQYDIVVVGGGPGGYVAAIKAAQLGAKVALIEKQAIGGVCLNWGCIPTKALLKSAKVYKEMMHSESYGIILEDKSKIKVDWLKVIGRKNDIVKRLTTGVSILLQKNGIDTYLGFGEIIDSTTVKVNQETLKTKNIILATGASPIILPLPGLKEAMEKGFIVTAKEILALKELPSEVVIIGGGVIGIEFASIFATFGTKVTILERLDKILINIDDEIRSAYIKTLEKSNIKMITQANVVAIKDNKVTYHYEGKDQAITADKILMSVGMKPNISGFETLGLEVNRQGVVVNEKMQTNIPNVYAIGDMTGKNMLAHVASMQGIVAAENIVGKHQSMDYTKVPACIYGMPEIAMVGITEAEAKEKNLAYTVSKFPVAANGKSLADGETDGFIKIIADQKYGELLGVHIMGSNATELISESVTTMELEGTAYEVAKAIHPHPTLSEIMMEAAHGIIGKPIHTHK